MEIAPGSEFLSKAGHAALYANRPREAIEFLTQADPESGWLRGWFFYWDRLTEAYHILGDHERELEAARRASRQYPDRPGYEIRALVALGRVSEIDERIEGFSSARGARGRDRGGLMLQAANELYVHGNRAAARRMWHRVIDWSHGRPWYQGVASNENRATAAVNNQRFVLVVALYRVGQLDESWEIWEVIRELAGRPRMDIYSGWFSARIAARRGDREAALRDYRLLEQKSRSWALDNGRSGNPWYWEAVKVLALLGERQRAVEVLREGRSGSVGAWPLSVHVDSDFESLWDYPPFQELIRPKG